MLPNNLISDLEKAIVARSAETGAMLRKISDLFLLHVGHYTADQVDLYDDILQALIAHVEVAARATLAKQLAPISGAPPKTIRTLALDDAIEVAEPILSLSPVVDADTLTHCITIKGQDYLLAIAKRNKISEAICYQLISKGNREVLGTLASNVGASISDPSFGLLVEKSINDDWLLERVAGRGDIPEHHLRELLSKASEIVRQRLTAADPGLSGIIEKILPLPAPIKRSGPPMDYRAAEFVVKSRELNEALVIEFAKERKIAEIMVSIAGLSGLSVDEVERLLIDTWASPVAIILKAIGFRLSTVDAIYHARLSSGERARKDLIQTKAEFIALSRPTAERILRFFCAKRAAMISNYS